MAVAMQDHGIFGHCHVKFQDMFDGCAAGFTDMQKVDDLLSARAAVSLPHLASKNRPGILYSKPRHRVTKNNRKLLRSQRDGSAGCPLGIFCALMARSFISGLARARAILLPKK